MATYTFEAPPLRLEDVYPAPLKTVADDIRRDTAIDHFVGEPKKERVEINEAIRDVLELTRGEVAKTVVSRARQIGPRASRPRRAAAKVTRRIKSQLVSLQQTLDQICELLSGELRREWC
jgi:hypothetical protein